MSDGLVTNVSLILGIAGAHPAAGIVRLAGLAVLIGGAFSMAAGEYTSMRAQRELLERELDLERHEITHRPEGERRELVRIYEDRGVQPFVANRLAEEMMRTPELALETHAREELGISPGALGSPVQAASASFATFALGAFFPLLPWLITSGTSAVLASVCSRRGCRTLRRRGAFAVHRAELVVVGVASATHIGRRRRCHLLDRKNRRYQRAVRSRPESGPNPQAAAATSPT